MDEISMAASPSSSALLRCRTCRMAPLRQYQVCPVDAILTEDDGKTAADMIYELTEILVTIDRNLPQFVCLSCVEDLRTAYGFRQRCLEANEAFLAELDEDGLATAGETSVDAADPSMLVLKMEPCDAELMDPEENEELLEALADDGNRTTVSRKKRKSFTFNQIAVHYIVEQDDGRHHCAIDEQSGCGYSQGALELGNFIRHFRMKHKWEAERKGFMPGVPPKEIPQAIEASKDAVFPTNSPKRTKKSPATSMSKFIKRSGNTYRCAIDEQRVCSYSRNRRDMSCFFRHFRTAHPKAAVANNLCNQPKRKARTVRIPPPEKVETEPKKELPDERQKSNNSNETNYCKIAIQYVKSVNGKFQCAIDESSDCRYAQRSNYDAGNFIRHFRKLHPLEAFEKNLVRSDMHSAMIAEEQKRIARKHTVSIVPAEVLEACIQLMAVHNLPVQCFGWAGMQTLLDRLTTTLEFKINDRCMVEHIQKSAERMIWIAQQEMRGKLISIHVESMAHGKIHYLIIRVTEALPARDAKARFLELLERYQLSTKQIAVIVLGNIGSVPGTPEKLQSFFADSLIKPNFKFGAPNKEEALMDSLAEELRGQFEVVRNVVSVILTTLNEMFSDTDPAFVRIDRYLQDLRSPQYEGFFLEHNAPYPPTWHSQWISKFQSVRCIVEQEQLLMKLAQKHPELALEEPDWQLLREFHQALLPLHAFIERLERTSDEHVPFSSFYLECLSVVKTVRRGMASNRFSKPVSDALGKRLLALRERKVFQAALYLDPRFQHYQSAVLSPDQQAGGQMEPCDSELMDVQKEVDPEYPKDDPLWSDHKNTSTKRRNSKGKPTKVAYTKIAAQFVKERDGRFECHFDPDSGCRYAQRLLDLNNYVRHCRTKHKERASRLGLVVGVPATDEVPFKEPEVVDTVQTGEERKPSLKYPIIARKLIKKSQKGTFFCAIDERSRCRYSQTKRSLLNFVRHFRRAHAKEATKYDLFRKMVAKKPVHLVLKRRIPRSDGVNLAEILTHHIKRLDGMFWCAIDEQSPCKYVQENYSMSNFLRHFRTVHPMEAMIRNLAGKDSQVQIENRKRYARKIQVSIDQPVVLQACIQLVAEHNLPIECFRWSGFLSLMRPLKTGLELEMDKTSMVQHIHQAVERQISMIRYEMQARLVFVEIESFVHEGNHFLTVSVNYELNLRVLTRVLGLIRATDATPVSELKTKILDLFGRYQLQEEQIIAIVLGNLGSMLGTPKKLQEQFADSLIKPRFVYGDVDRENTLMDALSAELQGQFEVVRNVVCSVFSALNEVVPNADPDFQRIEQFIQDLRSPKYEDSFNEHQIAYPTSWCSQRWIYKYKAIRSIVKREQFYVASAQQHPELALAETDWQFLREYHDAFYPLHKLLKTLEQNRDRQHVTFSAFYMQCLMAIKDVRGIDNRFSKPIMAALSQWLMELRERNIFQTMLYLDPRFQYFKSVVLTLEQQNDAQSYILNIWNRINALKPNSEANQIDDGSIKQEDKKDDDMDDFLSEMFGDPAEGSSKSKAIPLNSTVTPVLQQLKSLEIEPRQPHDYDVWNHWLQRSMSHAELFSVAMVVMSLPTNNICLERSYAALVLADRSDGLSEETLDELLLIRLNRSLFEKAVLTMYDWKKVTRPQE